MFNGEWEVVGYKVETTEYGIGGEVEGEMVWVW
jgi:hypothetical protein